MLRDVADVVNLIIAPGVVFFFSFSFLLHICAYVYDESLYFSLYHYVIGLSIDILIKKM